jgi:hypothetical protein
MTIRWRGRWFRFPPIGTRPAEGRAVAFIFFAIVHFAVTRLSSEFAVRGVSLQRLVNVQDSHLRPVHDFRDDIV